MSRPRQFRKKTFRFDQIKRNGLELEESLVQLLRESKWLVTVEPSISTCLSAVAARPEKLSDNERESGRWNQKGFCSSLCDVIDDLAQDIVPFLFATSLSRFAYLQRNGQILIIFRDNFYFITLTDNKFTTQVYIKDI